jgi:HD-like signal output (HDOD) protein
MVELKPPFSAEQIIARTRTVCSPPFIYSRLNEAINHPRTSIKDIAQIINEDQGLTVRLLKLANSPLFGYLSKVDTISRAVTIVGTQQLRDLALAASVMGVFKNIPEELMSMSLFWRHSVTCGIFSRNLAVYLREPNVERFFVAGMLHDLGQLVMCTTIPGTVTQLLDSSRDNKQLHHLTERQKLGFNHATLGGALLNAWKLPVNITEPVACHHAPDDARKFPLEAAVVHLAEIFCQAMKFGFAGEEYVAPLQPKAWERLGIPVNMLSTIIHQSEPQIEEIFAILTENP